MRKGRPTSVDCGGLRRLELVAPAHRCLQGAVQTLSRKTIAQRASNCYVAISCAPRWSRQSVLIAVPNGARPVGKKDVPGFLRMIRRARPAYTGMVDRTLLRRHGGRAHARMVADRTPLLAGCGALRAFGNWRAAGQGQGRHHGTCRAQCHHVRKPFRMVTIGCESCLVFRYA